VIRVSAGDAAPRRGAGPAVRAIAAITTTLALIVALAATARTQPPRPAQPFDPQRPLLIEVPGLPDPPSSHPLTPLDGAQAEIVRQAEQLRLAHQLDEARKKLATLPASAQSHPVVITQKARIELAASNWNEVVRLGAERKTQRDSLLIGRELVQAYEHLDRARDASQTVTEIWADAPVEENWAMRELLRLAPNDSHVGRDGVRRALNREPQRTDLARGLAQLEWAAGDMHAALKVLKDLDHGERGPRARWMFAENLLLLGTARDTSGACEVFLDMVSDPTQDPMYRSTCAQRYWMLLGTRGQQVEGAPKFYQSMKDVPPERWGGQLVVEVARALREGGNTADARTLLSGAASGPQARPDVMLERGLADLRDGPPEKALDALKPGPVATEEQKFTYAEALFFAGQPDSAMVWYKRVSDNPAGEHAGAALERMFQIEDADPKSALPAFGRVAYEQWRGPSKRGLALAESLWTKLPRGALWAQAAMIVCDQRELAGDPRGAVTPALAVADSLPDDRLAPFARQRAGDLYSRLKEDAKAVEQYEACLARYPRAWNAPEVRRKLEELRRTRRF